MIEITDVAAEVLKGNMIEGRVVRMLLAATDATGANYVLAWGDAEEEDLGRGFIIQGPEDDDSCGCGHDHGQEDDHGCGCGH